MYGLSVRCVHAQSTFMLGTTIAEWPIPMAEGGVQDFRWEVERMVIVHVHGCAVDSNLLCQPLRKEGGLSSLTLPQLPQAPRCQHLHRQASKPADAQTILNGRQRAQRMLRVSYGVM